MKQRFLLIVTICIISIIFTSCKKESALPATETKKTIAIPDELKAQLEQAADKVFLQSAAPGIIALVSIEGYDDLIIKRGVSDIVSKEPMNETNHFRIASNTKPFTGEAVLMLVDEGKINLDSSISYYLPQYNIPNGNKITVRMLGRMRSGLYNYSDDPGLWTTFEASNFIMTFPPDSLLTIAFRHPPNFAPDSGYEYCNTGIVLLGLLIEKVTGKPANEVIYEKIIKPLKLNNTYWGSTFFLTAPYCKGYNSDFLGALTDVTNWNPSWGYTAGQLVSNIADMKAWAKLDAEGIFLSDKMKAERFNFGPEGYGFCIERVGNNWVGHPGIIFGFNSQIFYNAAKKTTLVIYSNTDTGLPAQELLIKFVMILGI